ncbi:hypothetical protein BAE44_0022032, partial [Dichanthelium oligosanthes]
LQSDCVYVDWCEDRRPFL